MPKSKPIDPEPIERVGIFPARVWYTLADAEAATDRLIAHGERIAAWYTDAVYRALADTDAGSGSATDTETDAGLNAPSYGDPDTGSNL